MKIWVYHSIYSKPKSRHIIPDYVIPSEKKRDEVRFNIRMKMYFASGITFPSTLDAQDKRKVPNHNAKVAEKITIEPTAEELTKYI